MAIKFNQVILNKLFENKTELSKKTELNLGNDLKYSADVITANLEFIKEDYQYLGEAVSKIKMIENEITDSYRELETFNDLYSQYENAANELGLDMSEPIIKANENAKELRRVTGEIQNLINSL
tara:strand:- start:159 stop:530 length:372 start_codon:yes stop_codon:yes gene_type:complete